MERRGFVYLKGRVVHMFGKPYAKVDMVSLGIWHMVVYVDRNFQRIVIGLLWLDIALSDRWGQFMSEASPGLLCGYLALYVATLVGECIEVLGSLVLALALVIMNTIQGKSWE